MTINYPLQIAYLASSVLFILGLKALSSPASARRGIIYAEIGMLMAVVGTLLGHHIITWEWILVGSLVGSVVGAAMAIFMPMTAMPQRIALSHSFGALAAVLVGVAEYHQELSLAGLSHGMMSALGFEILFGSLTITGSLMAFGKLQELITRHADHLQVPERHEHRACSSPRWRCSCYLICFPQAGLAVLRDAGRRAWSSAC